MEVAFKISQILLIVSYVIASLFLYFSGYLGEYRIYILTVFVTIQIIALICWITGYQIRKEVLNRLE